MRLRRSIMSIVVVSLAAAACSSSATPTPSPTEVPTSAPAASASEAASSSGSAAPSNAGASPSAEASAQPSGPPASLPPTTTFTFKGDKTANSKPFTMWTPARISWSSSGSGPFTAVVVPTGGINNISTGTIADVTGRASGTTWIYGDGSSSEVTINVTATGSFGVTVMSPVPPTVLSVPANFNGSFGMTTQPFSTSGDIAITYSTQGDFDLTLIDATTGYSVVNAATVTGATMSSTVIHDLNGTYAFDVTTKARWSIQVKAP
jgi:hypothetical protein